MKPMQDKNFKSKNLWIDMVFCLRISDLKVQGQKIAGPLPEVYLLRILPILKLAQNLLTLPTTANGW